MVLRPKSTHLPELSRLQLALWRDSNLTHFVAVKDKISGKFRNIAISSIDEAADLCSSESAAGNDVYIAFAEYETSDNRKAENVSQAIALWLDIDCGPDKAVAGKGYGTVSEAKLALTKFYQNADIQQPTHLIESGGGLHVYWTLNKALDRVTWQKVAREFKALTAHFDLLADPSRTADIASILRVPGTYNYKYDPPSPVELIAEREEWIDTDQLVAAIDAAYQATQAPPKETATPVKTVTVATGGNTPNAELPVDLDKLASALKVLDPDCDDETWKLHRIAPLGLAARQNPEQAEALKILARRWSSGELQGKPAKAWTTPGNTNGMTGEQVFDTVWDRFIKEDHTNPVTIATIYKNAMEAGWSPAIKSAPDAGNNELRNIQERFCLLKLDGKIWVLDRSELNKRNPDGTAKPLALSNRSDGSLLIQREVIRKYPSIDDGKVANQFFKDPGTTVYHGIEFNPKATTPGHLNLWVGHTLQPVKGDWSLIRHHLLHVICNGDEAAFDYLHKLLAHALQKPEEKPGVMLILLGGQGTGKGTLGRILQRIWATSYLHVANIEHATGSFNASLEQAFWVFLDEALFVGDRRSTNVLKSLVTEPHVLINQKHQPVRMIGSVHRFVLATNADHVMHMEPDDRRGFTLRVSDAKKGDHDYFRALYAEIEGSGCAAMVHDLLELDLTGFNVRQKPHTQELLSQKLQSLGPIQQWWYERLEQGVIDTEIPNQINGDDSGSWPDFIPTKAIIDGVKDEYVKTTRRNLTGTEVKTVMAKICPGAMPKQQTTRSDRVRGYSIPSLDVARAEFEAYIGSEIDW